MDQKREKLMEDYEDALFAIVMDQIAEEEGERLEQEAQRLEDEDFQVPDSLDRKCIAAIREAEEKQRRAQKQARRRISIRRIGRVALVAVLTIVLIASIAYAAIPEFRAGVLNLVLKVTKQATSITMVSGSDVAEENPSEFDFTLTYIPEGFYLSDASLINSDYAGICYEDGNGNNFVYGYDHLGKGHTVSVDTEDADVQYTTLRGCEGLIVQKTNPITGQNCVSFDWFDTEQECRFFAYSHGLPYSEMEKIYNGLIITKK